MEDITTGRAVPTIAVLQGAFPTAGLTSDCWCPNSAGACRAPYDRQPAALTATPAPLGPCEEAAFVLIGSILEHLRDGHPHAAARQARHLVTLVELM